jgi:hypothetical protein
MIDEIKYDPYFAAIVGQLTVILDKTTFKGWLAEQVNEFLAIKVKGSLFWTCNGKDYDMSVVSLDT